MIENDFINSIINKFKYEKTCQISTTQNRFYIYGKQQCNIF